MIQIFLRLDQILQIKNTDNKTHDIKHSEFILKFLFLLIVSAYYFQYLALNICFNFLVIIITSKAENPTASVHDITGTAPYKTAVKDVNELFHF